MTQSYDLQVRPEQISQLEAVVAELQAKVAGLEGGWRDAGKGPFLGDMPSCS